MRRGSAESGSVVSRVSGEDVRFVTETAFRPLLVGQDLLGGDLVRTGARGALGILFVDGTVMRLHPDTELLVKSVGAAAELELTRGTIWARAPRGTSDVTVTTPAAAAGIRGTDWALSVEGSVTRLTVYDGAVELSNAQGSVLTNAGEAAVASPGQAPIKVGVANRREAPQMLYTVGASEAASLLLSVTNELAADAGENPDALAEYNRALALLRAGEPGAAQALDRVAPQLGTERAATARWLAVFARSERGGSLEPPPTSSASSYAVGAAVAAAMIGNLEQAQTILGTVSGSPSVRGAEVILAVYRDDEDRARALAAVLERTAPGSAASLQASAVVAAEVDGNYAVALRLLKRAVAIEPEQSELWNQIGLAEDALDHPLEAEAAFRRGLELEPYSPALLGNLAILLLDLERVDEARAVALQLLERDPSSFLGLRALGRAAIQAGDPEAGDILLRSLAAQPAAAEGSLVLAISAYMDGDRTRAEQELDAAERLDPNDPTAPLIRSIIALDLNLADDAIIAARRAAELYRRNDRSDRSVAADRQTGSPLADAYATIALDGWARYTADRTYDPLSASSLFGEGYLTRLSLGRDGPSASGNDASLFNGLLLEPLAASYRLRFTDILRRPFLDGEISYADGKNDATRTFGLQGFVRTPVPLAFAIEVEDSDSDLAPSTVDERSGLLLLGTQFGARSGGFLLASRDKTRFRTSVPFFFGLTEERDTTVTSETGGIGGHVRLRDRAFLVFFAGKSRDTTRDVARSYFATDRTVFQIDADSETVTTSDRAHIGYRAEDSVGSWTVGLEGGRVREMSSTDVLLTDLLTGFTSLEVFPTDESDTTTRAFIGRRHRISPDLLAEGLATFDRVGGEFRPGGRLGLAWSPADRQWLRGAVIKDGYPQATSLVPAAVVGLVPLRFPYQPGGSMSGAMFRYDIEIGDRGLVSLEHQRLHLNDLTYETGIPGTTFDPARSRASVTSLQGDWWAGEGVGLTGSITHAKSRIQGGPFDGSPLPEVPEWTAELGIGFLRPSGVGGALRGVWTSERFSGTPGVSLPSVLTWDAGLYWESPDKRLLARVDVANILDEPVAQTWGLGSTGRVVALNLTARF